MFAAFFRLALFVDWLLELYVILLPVVCSRAEPYLRQNLPVRASAIHHRALICAIDDIRTAQVGRVAIIRLH